MRNPHDADDVFQDVFLRYAERAPAFRDDNHRRAWLLRVTINRCRSLQRSAWFRRIVPLEHAGSVSSPPPADPALSQALDSLPAKYRTVVHLSCYEHMDAQEIAELLGVKAVSVRSQLSRARAMLRELLKEEDEHA
ncbi:MAG: sigma-70 family RNA polymerase sigma factor [Clostridia bacterium]|nr:sigma-70 family RNA polymerase sigma factor [Clostridia bacterium]